jgi:ankyrin repeat protein
MRRQPYSYDVKPPQYLLDIQKKGAKTNVPKFMFKDELSKLLFVAVNEQDIGAIKGLLLKGGNINVQNKVNEYTPLMYAVENNKLDSLRYLILRGASLNVVTSNKMSALHLAAITSNLRALRILLSADTDIFLQDKYNKTFFDYVEPNYKNMVISDIFDTRKDASEALIDFCILGSIEGAKFSLQNRANVNSQNHNGDTPLILAVRNNNPQLVTYLLSVGANEAIKNNYKDDAKAVAKKNRYNKILDIMETVKHNKHLHLLGVSENVIPYQLSNEEKERIEKNKKEIADKNFANYSSQGVLGKINEKPKKK